MSLWALEYRHRERKNGKWSEWATDAPQGRTLTVYREYPHDLVVSYPKYERRAVEFTRKESNDSI